MTRSADRILILGSAGREHTPDLAVIGPATRSPRASSMS